MENKLVISNFRFEYGFLSNFYESSIIVDEIKYKTVEHAFQAQKSLDNNVRKLIAEATTPAIAKNIGRKIELRSDWENVKYDIMLMLIRKKFENPILRTMLLNTSGIELVHSNRWHDTTWGVYNGNGKNLLGKILMQVRNEIKLCENDFVPMITNVDQNSNS